MGLVLGTTVGHSCGGAIEVCSGDVVVVRGNSEGAISFGIDGCGVIGDGVGNTAVVCCMAPTSMEWSVRSSCSVLE